MRVTCFALLALCSLSLPLFPTYPAEAGTSAPCVASQQVDDPPGDVQNLVGIPYDAPEMDILSANLTLTDHSLDYALKLAAKPGDKPNEYYRYWLGFYAQEPGGSPEYVDLRIASTATYDYAGFVGSNQHGNPSLGDYPVSWNGSTLLIRIPLEDLAKDFAPNTTFGAPTAQTDGIHRTLLTEGPATGAPYVEDFMSRPPFRPLVCLSATPASAPVLPAASRPAPLPFIVPLAATATAALLLARARRR